MESLAPPFPSEPDPDEEIRRIIGEVAKRHKIVVGPDDPTLAVLTMLELVAGRYLERADAMLQTQREGMLGAMERAAGASIRPSWERLPLSWLISQGSAIAR